MEDGVDDLVAMDRTTVESPFGGSVDEDGSMAEFDSAEPEGSMSLLYAIAVASVGGIVGASLINGCEMTETFDPAAGAFRSCTNGVSFAVYRREDS